MSEHERPDELPPTVRADDPADKPTEVAGHSASSHPFPDGGRFGPYVLLDVLGQGGMGAVYLAEQTEPVQRQVAVKVIKLGMDTRNVVARFEAERQALAVMDHPSIAKVFDAGATESGRPYFVMELVRGEPINGYCDRNDLSTRERLRLVMTICEAVQHAHHKGVIHRDLKPSNILIEEVEGHPLPKVIDFGVAKATADQTNETMHTIHGQMLGTPEYMSPEQAGPLDEDVDTRADIYSLGVILYELLTGELPFDSKTLRSKPITEMQRIIVEDEPTRPSERLTGLGPETVEIAKHRRTDPGSLTRQLKGDLDWIVMKAMDKDRDRRYQTSKGLALDIERHLRHEPIRARPPSGIYRFQKFVRRNKLGVSFASLMLAALLAGVTGTVVGMVQAKNSARRATAINQFLRQMLVQVHPEQAKGQDVTVRQALDLAAADVDASFVDQPEVQADLHATVGMLYRELGHFDNAEPHLIRALDMRIDQLGTGHAKTMDTTNELAMMLFQQRKYDAAEPYFVRWLELADRKLGADDPVTLTGRQNLAACYLQQKRYEEAEELLLRVREGRTRVLGPDHKATLSTLNNLAECYKNTDRLTGAEPIYLHVLESRTEQLGADHPRTLVSRFNLGDLFFETQRYAKAEPLYRAAFDGFRQVYGEDHPYSLIAMRSLAAAQLEMGDPRQAVVLALDSQQRHDARYGEDNEESLKNADLLVRIYESLEDRDAADRWRARLDE